MGYIEMIPVTSEQLDQCDTCGHDGLKTSGYTIKNNYGEAMIFFCFNCKYKLLNP